MLPPMIDPPTKNPCAVVGHHLTGGGGGRVGSRSAATDAATTNQAVNVVPTAARKDSKRALRKEGTAAQSAMSDPHAAAHARLDREGDTAYEFVAHARIWATAMPNMDVAVHTITTTLAAGPHRGPPRARTTSWYWDVVARLVPQGASFQLLSAVCGGKGGRGY